MHTTLEKKIHRHFLRKDVLFNTSIDSKLKWLPFAAVFLGDMFGVKTRDSWKKQVYLTGVTEAIRYLIADNLKTITNEHRPAPYHGNRSFPSGHACSAFAGAEFMRRELKDAHPLLAHAGYLGGIAAASIRVIKSRHWLRDVVAGAAIGVISASLAYCIVNSIQNRLAKKPGSPSKQLPQLAEPD